MGILASLNANPNVNPSAHLWHTTANDNPNTSDVLLAIPIANPSNIAWIPIAIYKINGVKFIFFFGYNDYTYIDLFNFLAIICYVCTKLLNTYSSYWSYSLQNYYSSSTKFEFKSFSASLLF